MKIQNTHIDNIRVGDTVEHNGVVETVCAKNIKRDRLMGTTLFGDNYRLGTKPVKRIIIERPLP